MKASRLGWSSFLALVLLAEQGRDHFGLDAEQRREHADVDDVLEQLALARIGCSASSTSVSGTPSTWMSLRNFDGGSGFELES